MQPDAIVLHHSATTDSRTNSWEAIRRFHTSYRYEGTIISAQKAKSLKSSGHRVQRPWKDIGYHFGIERIDNSYQIMTGRPMDQPGAHCTQSGMNRRAIGICFVGNFDAQDVPEDQWQLGLELIRALMRQFAIPSDFVFGHREFASYKSCPGRRFDLERFRREIEGA